MNSAKETRGIERGKARRLQPLEVSPIAWSIMVAFMLLAVLLMPATAADIFTVAGTGLPGSSGDGGPATAAKLNAPYVVALDAAGNLFIVDERGTVASAALMS